MLNLNFPARILEIADSISDSSIRRRFLASLTNEGRCAEFVLGSIFTFFLFGFLSVEDYSYLNAYIIENYTGEGLGR